MTIQEVVTALQKEKQASVPSRFPCRAIMVRNIHQYCELLSELKKISDIRFVQSQELFTNADTMPKYENLKRITYQDQWVILTGVSEYLRLFEKNEIKDRRFSSLWGYQAPASSIGRIIIPLWGCEAQWFDKVLNLSRDLRQKDFFYDCTDASMEDQIMKLLVLSGKFEKYLTKLETMRGDLKIGLQDWFEYWIDPEPDKNEFVLLTKRSNSVGTINGNITIHVIRDTLTLIQENMQGSTFLTAENCNDAMQGILLEHALKGYSLDAALLNILNMSEFSGLDIMGKWKSMDINHKLFVKMWYSLHPDNSYLCFCFSDLSNVALLEETVMLKLFRVWVEKPQWVQEYRDLVQTMKITPDSRFFKELDSISVYDKRLDFITGAGRDEQIYILRMVGKWMREDYNQVVSSERLRSVYPELFAYLDDVGLPFDDDIKHYMAKYKAFKLENTLPDDEDVYFSGVQADTYDMRYSILSEYVNSDSVVLWIDALGVEWSSLLRWTLARNCDATIKRTAIGQACLPTETQFNNQWEKMSCPYDKLDKLDKLAHKGVVDEPDYYACIQEQLAFIKGVQHRVTKLMSQYHRVIITGDHGTSRLAARLFHKRDGMPLPKNAIACSHGRYCLLHQDKSFSIPNTRVVTVDNSQYVVFLNYDHFTQSGFAAGADDENAIFGEIHGGGTPEEALVPIIVLDSNREVLLSGSWENNTVKISMKKARLRINFNKPVTQLQVVIAGISGEVSATSDAKNWNLTFRGISPGTYPPQVYADNRIVSMPDVTIMPALGGGEGDLPI